MAFILLESTVGESVFGESKVGESISFESIGVESEELVNQVQDVKDKHNVKAKKLNLNTFFMLFLFKS